MGDVGDVCDVCDVLAAAFVAFLVLGLVPVFGGVWVCDLVFFGPLGLGPNLKPMFFGGKTSDRN